MPRRKSPFRPLPTSRTKHLEWKLKFDRGCTGASFTAGEYQAQGKGYAPNGLRPNFCGTEVHKRLGKPSGEECFIRFSKEMKPGDEEYYVPVTFEIRKPLIDEVSDPLRFNVIYKMGHDCPRYVRSPDKLKNDDGILEWDTSKIMHAWLGYGTHEIWVAFWEIVKE